MEEERPSLARAKAESSFSFRLSLGCNKQGGSKSERDLQEGSPKRLRSKSVILHDRPSAKQDDNMDDSGYSSSSHATTVVELSDLQKKIRELEARMEAAMQMRTDEPGNNSHSDDNVEEGDAEKKMVGLKNLPHVHEEGKKNDTIDEVHLPHQETVKKPFLIRPSSLVLHTPKNDSSRLPEEASPTKQVRFNEVIVRHYAMILGDHPNCRYVYHTQKCSLVYSICISD